MSRRRKPNSRRPQGPRKPYSGPVLRTGRYIEFPDGVVCEVTIPRHNVSDEQWQRLIDEGLTPGWIEGSE